MNDTPEQCPWPELDLAELGTEPSERRAWVREPSRAQVLCRGLPAAEGQTRMLGRARDISTGGLSLVLRHRLRRGALVEVELETLGRGYSAPLLAEVVHVTMLAGGLYLLGCAFLKPSAAGEQAAAPEGTAGPQPPHIGC